MMRIWMWLRNERPEPEPQPRGWIKLYCNITIWTPMIHTRPTWWRHNMKSVWCYKHCVSSCKRPLMRNFDFFVISLNRISEKKIFESCRWLGNSRCSWDCNKSIGSWWRHQMGAFSALLAMGGGGGEFAGHRWIPRTKASDAELWYFLCSAPEYTVE